jgi:hypothetical protein
MNANYVHLFPQSCLLHIKINIRHWATEEMTFTSSEILTKVYDIANFMMTLPGEYKWEAYAERCMIISMLRDQSHA